MGENRRGQKLNAVLLLGSLVPKGGCLLGAEDATHRTVVSENLRKQRHYLHRLTKGPVSNLHCAIEKYICQACKNLQYRAIHR